MSTNTPDSTPAAQEPTAEAFGELTRADQDAGQPTT